MDLITITRKGGFEFRVGVRGHDVPCDLSESDGGGDAGPSPAELMAGSLGACVAMMAQGYCQKHDWEGDVEVSLTIEMADKPKRIGRIVIDLELPQSVPEERKEAIKRVVQLCPIHATLKDPPGLDIEVV